MRAGHLYIQPDMNKRKDIDVCKQMVNIIDLQKNACHKHKDLLHTLKDLEKNSTPSNLAQDPRKKLLIDSKTLDHLFKLTSGLLENDQRSLQGLQSLQENLKPFDSMKKLLKPIRSELMNTERSVLKELSKFESYISEFSQQILQHPKQQNQVSSDHIQKKLEQILGSLMQPDSIQELRKGNYLSHPVQLLKSFYLNPAIEEPEIELNCESENKKMMYHLSYLLKCIEKITESVLELYKHVSKPELVLPELDYDDMPSTISVTPSELKVLRLKINRLHNRGSLTDEEAKSMLGKISVIPVSPGNESSGVMGKNFFEKSFEIYSEDMPVTATHEKRKKKNQLFGKSFLKEISKKVKADKKVRKSTPGKRIVRNSSLPKAIIAGKGKLVKDKKSQEKLKSKSPHSFY